jgi:hypothetical protein
MTLKKFTIMIIAVAVPSISFLLMIGWDTFRLILIGLAAALMINMAIRFLARSKLGLIALVLVSITSVLWFAQAYPKEAGTAIAFGVFPLVAALRKSRPPAEASPPRAKCGGLPHS